MFVRKTSVPFRYTTAPSSRISRMASEAICAGSATVNARRKYVVMYFFF